MSRLPALSRALSSQAPRARPTVAGVRVDASHYTDTGGSGDDATALSASLEEASQNAVRLYRNALKDVPDMRKNFNIVEDAALVRHTIRDLFEKHDAVTDPKIIDMLVFKGWQELREIREQWKGRHHIYGYIQSYTEKLMREEAARSAQQAGVQGKDDLLALWRSRGLVPNELVTWPVFLKWKQDEDAKFHAFAVDHKLFTSEQLNRNSHASSQCTIM
ncbi:Complex 1 LYR protein [Gracilaria domingensis]|nr:Complex 1 LYR protein [Gracilaria domingensis]